MGSRTKIATFATPIQHRKDWKRENKIVLICKRQNCLCRKYKVIYNNNKTKQKTQELINELWKVSGFIITKILFLYANSEQLKTANNF